MRQKDPEYKSSTNNFLEWKEAKSDQWQHCFLVNFISDRLCLILKLLLCVAYLPFILAQFCKSPWEQFFGGRCFCCIWGNCWHVRFTLILIILSCGIVTDICYLRYTIIHDSPMNNVDTVSCVKYLMIWLRTIQFEMHRPVFFNRFDWKTLWLNSEANNVAKTILRGFICTSLSWLSVTSSCSQCCWTRMASQMIECYQFRCHFVESHEMACYIKWEAYSGPISFEVERNDIWTDNIQSFDMPF